MHQMGRDAIQKTLCEDYLQAILLIVIKHDNLISVHLLCLSGQKIVVYESTCFLFNIFNYVLTYPLFTETMN